MSTCFVWRVLMVAPVNDVTELVEKFGCAVQRQIASDGPSFFAYL
jgi:hypothetical protein